MTASNVSLLNAVTLVAVGLYGYFASEDPSPTALIPVGFGAALLACNPGVRRKNKVIAHIAVVATLLILLGLVMPLRGALGRSDSAAVARVAVMMVTTVLALAFFVQSFVAARRERVAASDASN